MATRDEMLDQIPGLAAGDIRAPGTVRRGPLTPETEITRNLSNTLNAVPGGTAIRSAQRVVGSLPRMIASGEAVNLARTTANAATPARTIGAGLRTAASVPVAGAIGLAALSARGGNDTPTPSTAPTPEPPRAGLASGPVYSRLADGSVVSSQLDADGRAQGIMQGRSPFARGITPGVSVGDQGDASLALQREARAVALNGESTRIAQDLQGGPTPGVVAGISSTTQGNFRGASNEAAFERDRVRYLAERGDTRAANALAGSIAARERNAAQLQEAELRESGENARARLSNATTRVGQEITRRGQDLDYEASVYGSDARNAIARAQLASTERDKADARASARSDFTVNLFKGEFTAKDKDGKEVFDEVGARRAADALNRIAPNFSALPKAEQEQKKFDAILAARQAAQLAQPAQIGLDALNPLAERPARNERTPDIRGGSLEKYGLFRGAITPGVSAEDYVVTGADGRRYNVGNLSLDEIEQYRRDMAR